jgi:hypothetical protein
MARIPLAIISLSLAVALAASASFSDESGYAPSHEQAIGGHSQAPAPTSPTPQAAPTATAESSPDHAEAKQENTPMDEDKAEARAAGQPQPDAAAAEAPAPGQPQPSLRQPSQQPPISGDRFAVQADKVFVTESVLAAEGNVVVRTEDYTISSDTVEVDRRSEVARFKGHVVIEGNNQRTEGTELWIDLDSGWWRIENSKSQVQPEFFATEVLEPLYGKGSEAEYEPDADTIRIRHGRMSSCELWRHYEIRSSTITLKPGDRVKLHRPALYLWGRKVFEYPFDVTFSLREEEQKIFPEIGQNEVEGRFLKLAALYYMSVHNSGVARLHLTEKRGIGFGFDHLLQDARQTLDMSVFDEPSQGALAARARHSYNFSRSFSSDLSANYQTNSGYLYSGKTLTSDLSFRNTDADSDSTLGFQQSTTSSGFGSSTRFGSMFYHHQRLGQRTSWSIRDTYVRSRFTTQNVPDEEMNADFQLRHQAPAFDIEMQANKRYDLDGSRYAADDRYYSLDRLPAIVVTTDTRKLGDWRAFGRAYTRLQADLGYFSQQPDDQTVIRGAFTADLGGYEHRLDHTTVYRTGLRFRQSWFDDGSAQYNTYFNGELRHAVDAHWHTRIGYGYAATRGFAPLRLDYGGRSNEIQWQLVRLSPDRSRVELSSGFDFISDVFRDLRLLAEIRSSANSYWRIQTAYSLDRSKWWPIILRYTTAGRALYLDLTSRYDIETSKLATVTADADLQLGRWWRAEFVGSYSGFTGRLDQADLRITRDLHCLVAQLTYTKWPRELSFAIGIKAFPAAQRMLGIGATGAYLPSAPGEYY